MIGRTSLSRAERYIPAGRRGRRGQLGLAALCGVLAASLADAQEERCYTEGATQFAFAIHYCVSSVLRSQGANTYGPGNLADGNPATAWCEGAPGQGIGETITLHIDDGGQFRRLLIRNGYGKSGRTYLANSRPETVEITTDRTPPTIVHLIDQNGILPVPLIAPAEYAWVRLRILSVYPGTTYTDTCVDYIAPDFEHEEMLLIESQRSAPPGMPGPGTSEQYQGIPPVGPEAEADATCIATAEPVAGTVFGARVAKGEGGEALVFLLQPAVPVCVILADGGAIGPVQRIQIIPDALDDFLILKDLGPGRLVRVRGRFEVPHEPWHVGDVILTDPLLEVQ